MRRAFWAVLLVGVAAGADDKKDDPIKGNWVVVTMIQNGRTNERAVGDKVSFDAGALTIRGQNRETKGSYKVDATKDPKEVDITPSDGPDKDKVANGIFRIDKGELHLCLGRPGQGNRPTAFESKDGSEHMLVTLKRE